MTSDPASLERMVLVELVIAAPRETIWNALRSRSKLSQWFGWDYPGLQDEIDFIFFKHAHPDDQDFALRFEQWEGSEDRFELEEHPDGTLLRVVRSKPNASPDWREAYDETAEGWLTFVAQLKLMIERHRNKKRRTIYLSGNASASGGLATDLLQIGGLFEAKVNRHYTADCGPDHALTGTIFHKSPFQIGLVVDEWGEGLLVVTNRPATDKSPFGGGALLITTYGLSPAVFDTLATRWRAWWAERYPPALPATGETEPQGAGYL